MSHNMYSDSNPNVKNYSFTAPKGYMLAIDLLIEWGIYGSRSEIIREAVRRVLLDHVDIIKELTELIDYVPLSRVKRCLMEHTGNGKPGRVINNGYIIMKKGMNEE